MTDAKKIFDTNVFFSTAREEEREVTNLHNATERLRQSIHSQLALELLDIANGLKPSRPRIHTSPFCVDYGEYDSSAQTLSIREMKGRGLIGRLVVIGKRWHRNTVKTTPPVHSYTLRDTQTGKIYNTRPMRAYLTLGCRFIPTPVGYRADGTQIMPDEEDIIMYRGECR